MTKGIPLGPIQWRQINEKDKMKAKLLKQNKHHLQHMVKEKTPSS